MILKEIDSDAHKSDIRVLNNLLKNSTSDKQKALISQDIAKLENGHKAEKDHAYYIDIYLKDSENSVILHDIRLEHNGITAQFDHILINRVEIAILESKSFNKNAVLEIKDDNSLEVSYKKSIKTFHNPIEQNKRHKELLKSFLKDSKIFGNRIELLGGFSITHKVLIHPETTVSNKKMPDGFVRGDAFVSQWVKEADDIGFFKAVKLLFKVVSRDTIKDIGNLLINNHSPKIFDYTQKYKMPTKLKKESDSSPKLEQDCPRCRQGKLVLRKASKKPDKYKSNEFFGCSRYPNCKFKKEVD